MNKDFPLPDLSKEQVLQRRVTPFQLGTNKADPVCCSHIIDGPVFDREAWMKSGTGDRGALPAAK